MKHLWCSTFLVPMLEKPPTVCRLVYAAMGLRSTPCVFVLSIPSMQFLGGNNLELVGWFSDPQDNCSLHLIQCDQYVYMHIYIHTYTIYIYRKPIHSHMVTEATRQTCHPFPNFIEKKGGVFPLGSRVARGGATLRHDLSRLCWLCSLLLRAMSFPDLCLTYG